jgi:diketogulonate reductase-like aldo/keto reductase
MDTVNRSRLGRREFSIGCAALGLTLSTPAALAAGPQPAHTVRLPDGTTVPALGQGAWHLGQGRHPPEVEEEALRAGMSLGMTLIDTSGNYGHGRSEQFLAHVLAGQRDKIYLVSKVEGDEVSGDGIARACDASLGRLGTDHIDLYLLHWPVAAAQFPHIVTEFEKLRAARKIHAWGVSNFDSNQMEELFRVPEGRRCATNQVPYSLHNRRIEHDVLPWCTQHNVPVMSYSPIGGDYILVVADNSLAQLGDAHMC